MSSCSRKVVAGKTMSAIAAVSVMNCSWTQTKRLERAKPRWTRRDSGATTSGVVFLDQYRRNRRSVSEIPPVAGQPRTDPRRIENSGGRIEPIEPLDQSAVELNEAEVRIEGATAFIGPGAGHRRQAADGEKLSGSI